MKETGLTGKRRSTTIAATPDQRSYSYAKIFNSRDSDRVARDEPHH